VNSSDPDGDDNKFCTKDDGLRLAAASPCKEAGNNSSVPDSATTEVIGIPRTIDGDIDGTATVDMGAYEFVKVWYVKAGASGAKTGISWADAFSHLQDALDVAYSGEEIWVADGTYKPTSDADRSISFELESGVALYGGFDATETSRNNRDWETNVTILSGDIDGDDVLDSDNSYNVIVGAAGATLDGFTVTKGYADHASTVQYQSGGGMYNNGCSPTVTNCIFDDNYAKYGGGMSNNSSSSPTVTDCDFTDNEAVYWGGGMENYSSSSPTITRCIFAGNAVTATNYGGGAIECYSSSNANIANCTISKNTAANGYAGGLFSDASSPTITNTIFWDNTDGYSDLDLFAASSGTITIDYSDISSSYYYSGEGDVDMSYCIIDTDPLFADAGNDDFHLKSAGGRWDPAASDWTDVGDDTTTSLCINTGDPSSSYSNEPTPNGSRINMGFYGNTSKASKTGYGSLKVNLTPGTAQWWLVGSGTWNNSGDSIGLVSHGDSSSYGIEFKYHPGYDTPSIMGGINIYPEQETVRNVTYDAVERYISPNGNNNYDGKSVAYAWQTINYAIHAVDALGGGKLYFDAQNGTYTDSLQSSDFDDLNYMTNCWHYNGGVYISASKSVFPSQHVSFTVLFTFDQ